MLILHDESSWGAELVEIVQTDIYTEGCVVTKIKGPSSVLCNLFFPRVTSVLYGGAAIEIEIIEVIHERVPDETRDESHALVKAIGPLRVLCKLFSPRTTSEAELRNVLDKALKRDE